MRSGLQTLIVFYVMGCLQQVVLAGASHGLGATANTQFGVKAAGVGFNGVEADDHLLRDLAVSETRRQVL